MQPYVKLIIENMRDSKADQRVRGSPAASGIWNIVRTVLRLQSVTLEQQSERETYVHSSTETRFKVFHSRMRLSMNCSQEFLNRASAGDTDGGFQSSGNGNSDP